MSNNKITLSKIKNVESAYYAYSGNRRLAFIEKFSDGRWIIYQSDESDGYNSARFFYELRRLMGRPKPLVLDFARLKDIREYMSKAISEADEFMMGGKNV